MMRVDLFHAERRDRTAADRASAACWGWRSAVAIEDLERLDREAMRRPRNDRDARGCCRSASSLVACALARRGGVKPGEDALGIGVRAAGEEAEAIELRGEIVEQEAGARTVGLGCRRPDVSSAPVHRAAPVVLTHDQAGTIGGSVPASLNMQSGIATLADAATAELRERILSGELESGAPLRLEELARSLGTSISPGARGRPQARGARARSARRAPRLARQGARRRRLPRHLRGAARARAGRGRSAPPGASRRPRSSAPRRRSRATRCTASAATGRPRAPRTTHSTSRSTPRRARTGWCA